MTLWICIGVYVVVMAVMPFVLSFMDGQPWVTRRQSASADLCMFFILLLWPIAVVLALIRLWACFMSEVGVTLFKRTKRALDALKEDLGD